MKRIIIIIGLIVLFQNANAALLLAMYQKMRIMRERTLSIDSLNAEEGSVHMQLSCALRYWSRGKYDVARHFLNKAVEGENDTAMVYLAEMDYYGYGLEQPNTGSALKFAKKALRKGNKLSYFIIGKNYYDNMDYHNAYKCFINVPDDSHNIQVTYYYLAKCHRYGRGVQIDVQKSLDYLKKAALSRNWWDKQFLRTDDTKDLERIIELLNVAK